MDKGARERRGYMKGCAGGEQKTGMLAERRRQGRPMHE